MRFKPLFTALFGMLCSACAGIDCSLDSVVVWTLTFYDSETETPLKLTCPLTIEAEGAGTLFNRGNNIESMELPMSLALTCDTLYLRWNDKDKAEDGTVTKTVTDMLYIDHTNYAHFDAIDCPSAVFHNISDARLVQHNAAEHPIIIDSLSIKRHIVDYNDVENIRLYIRPASLSDFDAESISK